MARTRQEPQQKGGSRLMLVLAVGFVLMVLVTLVIGIIAVINHFSGSKSQAPKITGGDAAAVTVPLGGDYAKMLQDEDGPAPIPWDGQSVVNVLLVGLDLREWTGDQTARTDSIIVLTMNPRKGTAAMVSLPRDLWVTLPGSGEGKINTAYFLGVVNQSPGGGAGMAVGAVEEFLKIKINYYVSVDWDAFIAFVDAIGGLDINVPGKMIIDPLGQGNTMIITPGVQTFDGAAALAYARARNTDNGDFDRAKRQQQVLMAVRDNVLNFYSLPKLAVQAPSLYDRVSKDVKTNMTLSEALQLAVAASRIDPKKIKQRTFKEDREVYATTSWNGEYILLPYPEQIEKLTYTFFVDHDLEASASATIQSTAQASIQATGTVKTEMARIVVSNGAGVQGLAARTGDYLASKEFNVVDRTNADGIVDYTEIHINSDKPATVAMLSQLLKVSPGRIFNEAAEDDSTYDIEVIVGSDWAADNPMPAEQ